MGKQRLNFLAITRLISCYASLVRSDALDHRYKSGDPVPLYANKVGPFHNPRFEGKEGGFREVSNGDRLVSAPYEFKFQVEKETELVCKKKLTEQEVVQFRNAVTKYYYFHDNSQREIRSKLIQVLSLQTHSDDDLGLLC